MNFGIDKSNCMQFLFLNFFTLSIIKAAWGEMDGDIVLRSCNSQYIVKFALSIIQK